MNPGSDLAAPVEDLTDVSRPDDGNHTTCPAIDREHTAHADPRAKTVKLADVIHNVTDISTHAPRFAPIYVKEKKSLLEVLKGGAAVMGSERVCGRSGRKKLPERESLRL